ncbi:MAG: 50S ribosomal protein L25 [Ignavibacteria bacterium]|jgi:large subunit ribosomal protein L25|nr:50S ribosomal protein L25 [Ignavibacteria bacterium]
MEKVELLGNVRTEFTKSARSTLRKNSRVPGVLYGKSIQPVCFDVDEKKIKPLVFTSEAHIISLKLDNQYQQDCVIKDVQFDPVTDRIVHFDAIGLVKGEKIELEVPVQLIGTPVGVRDGGQLQGLLHKLNISCDPTDIPESLPIDISELKMGSSIHVADLNYDNIVILNGSEQVVVTVSPPRGAKEATETDDVKTQPEVIAKGKEKEV